MPHAEKNALTIDTWVALFGGFASEYDCTEINRVATLHQSPVYGAFYREAAESILAL